MVFNHLILIKHFYISSKTEYEFFLQVLIQQLWKKNILNLIVLVQQLPKFEVKFATFLMLLVHNLMIFILKDQYNYFTY